MAMELQGVFVTKLKLGTQGLRVYKLGFGCMGLTGIYNDPVSEEIGMSIIKHAFDQGITLFDTSDFYGHHTNEVLVGKALKQLPREKVQLAKKFGRTKVKNLDNNIASQRVKLTKEDMKEISDAVPKEEVA